MTNQRWSTRLLAYCWRYKRSMLLALAASLLSVALSIAVPLIERAAVDDLVAPGGGRPVGPLLAALAAAAVLNFGATYLRRYHGGSMSLGVQFELRTRMQHKLLRTGGTAQQDGLAAGQALSRATSDLAVMQRLLSFTPLILGNLLLIAATVVAGALLDWRLALVLVVLAPVFLLGSTAARRRLFPATWHAQQAAGELAGVVDEFVSGVRVVKGLGQEPREAQRFESAARRLFASRMRTLRMTSRYNPALNVLPTLGQVAVFGLGAYYVMGASITLGTLLAFVTYVAQLAAPVTMLATRAIAAPQAHAALLRIFDIIDAQPDVVQAPDAHALPHTAHGAEIEFDAVGFGYTPSRPVLRDFSLRVAPGQTLALVGRVGSGKSTAALLTSRLFDAQHGAVRVRGQDVRDLTLSSLRSHIALVPEESFLFSESIRANIAFGKPDATDEEIRAAARAAGADTFVADLPDGYDTVVGEGGLTLSGGQRQRIAIARALVGQPPVLVLDDAMSALDAATQAELHATLGAILADRTVLLIAHRRSTLRLADRIAVVDGGTVTDCGTHDELMARCALYRLLLSGPGTDAEGLQAGEIHAAPNAPSPWQRPVKGPAPGPAARRGRPATADLLRKVAALPQARDLPHEADHDPELTAPLRMREMLRPFRRPLALLTALLLADTLAAIAFPLFVRAGIDHGAAAHRGAVIAAFTAAILAVALCGWAVEAGTDRVAGRVAERVLYRLRTGIFGHVQQLGLDFHEREGTGRLMTRMTADLDAIATFAQTSLVPMAVSSLTIVATFAVMVVLDPLLSLPLVAATPLAVAATVWFKRRSTRIYTASRTKAGEVNANLHESMRGARLSQAFDRDDQSRRRFRELSDDYRRARLRMQRNIAVYFPFMQFLFDLCATAAIWLSVAAVHRGTLTAGALLAYLIYLDMLFSPTQQVAQAFDTYQQAGVAVTRIGELLAVPRSEPPGGTALTGPVGTLAVDAGFHYPGQDRPALDGIRLTLAPGETVAVVGSSGAGKSSLVKLIARYYEPTTGSVTLDGTDVRDLDVRSYRQRVVTVPQEPFLFAGTVRDTIAYCRPLAPDDEVEAAARAAGAHDMVAALPGGYRHPVASRGENLSAGQRQLLALARAQMADPDVLLLDEATASLDAISQAAVTTAISLLARTRTTLLVAHRLTLAARADRIVVLDAGRVAEEGSHAHLLAADGLYRRMWDQYTEPLDTHRAPEVGAGT